MKATPIKHTKCRALKAYPDRPTRCQQLECDLSYAYCRLDHLLYIYRHPDSVPGGFGPHETMTAVNSWIKEMRARYGWKATWPEPTLKVVKRRKGQPVRTTQMTTIDAKAKGGKSARLTS